MVYLIESGDYYKIGFTKNWNNRSKEYETHNPNFKILRLVPVGTKEDETFLHKKLSEFKFKNEWFYKDTKIIEIFESYFDTTNNRILNVNRAINSLQGVELKLLILILNLSIKDSGNLPYIINDKVFKDTIKALGYTLSNSVIDRAVHTLKEKGFLTKVCKGRYNINVTNLKLL